MTHVCPTTCSTKVKGFAVCAALAALLFGPGFMTGAAEAADFHHGKLNGRHLYGCKDVNHYDQVAKATEQNKKTGQDMLDRLISSGDCRMLTNHAHVTVKGVHSGHNAVHVQLDGDSVAWWTDGRHLKHD